MGCIQSHPSDPVPNNTSKQLTAPISVPSTTVQRYTSIYSSQSTVPNTVVSNEFSTSKFNTTPANNIKSIANSTLYQPVLSPEPESHNDTTQHSPVQYSTNTATHDISDTTAVSPTHISIQVPNDANEQKIRSDSKIYQRFNDIPLNDIQKSFIHAYKTNNISQCRTLMKNSNVNINAVSPDGYTALIYSIMKNNYKIVQLLCSNKKCNVNCVDMYDKATALIWAAYYGRTDCMKLLLKYNANINLCDKDGYNILITACIHNQIHTVQYILSHIKKINVNAVDNDGRTALIWCCAKDHTEIVQLLLHTNKCNINQADNDGETALHAAIQFNAYKSIELLLKHHADITVADKDGNTCVTYAKTNTQLSELLQKYKLF